MISRSIECIEDGVVHTHTLTRTEVTADEGANHAKVSNEVCKKLNQKKRKKKTAK